MNQFGNAEDFDSEGYFEHEITRLVVEFGMTRDEAIENITGLVDLPQTDAIEGLKDV